MISKFEILKGQICPPELEANLEKLLKLLNQFRIAYGKPMICSSGYRTKEHNADVGGRPYSAHLTCEAADFEDPKHELRNFCLEHLILLETIGLWMEDPSYTLDWIHLQSRPAHQRVFIP